MNGLDYFVKNPKTGIEYRVSVAVLANDNVWTDAKLYVRERGAPVRMNDLPASGHIFGGASNPYLRLDSYSNIRGQGVGAVLYLACAVAAGDLGKAGVESKVGMRSPEAGRLWEKFIAHGVAHHVPEGTHGIDRLDAAAARATGFVKKAPRLGSRGNPV
jgi:hypothetical protein